MTDFKITPWTIAILALISGAFIGAAIGVIAALAGWPRPWVWFGAGWVISGAWTWGVLLFRFLRAAGVDESGPAIANPVIVSGAPLFAEVQLQQADGLAAENLTLPIAPHQMISVARAVNQGASFAMSLSGPGQPLSRADFENLRAYLIRRGYARWTNPRAHAQGVMLTAKGEALIRGYATLDQSHERTRARVSATGLLKKWQ